MYPQGIGQLSSPQQMPQQMMPQQGQMPGGPQPQMMPQQGQMPGPMPGPSPMPMSQPQLPEHLEGIGLNLAKTQEQLKDLADGQLMQYLQTGGGAPPVLVLGELNRRKRVRDGSAQQHQTTVADELMAEAMQGGIGAMVPRQGMQQGGVTAKRPRSAGPMSAALIDQRRGTPEALAALYGSRSVAELMGPDAPPLDNEYLEQLAASIARAEDPATASMDPVVVTPRGVLPPGVSNFFKNRRDDIRYAWDKIPRFPRSDLTDEELALHMWEDLRTAPEQLRLQATEDDEFISQMGAPWQRDTGEEPKLDRAQTARAQNAQDYRDRRAARDENHQQELDQIAESIARVEAPRTAALSDATTGIAALADAVPAEPLPSSPRSGRSGVRGPRPDVPRPDSPPRPRSGRSGSRSPRLEDEVLPAEDTTPPAAPPAPPATPPAPPAAGGFEALAASAAAEAEPKEDPTPNEDNPLDTKTPFGRELRRAERSNINIPLMMAGLAMLSSNRPDFFGALGEGGVAGLKTLVELRQQEDALMDREADRMQRAADREADRLARAAEAAENREARAAQAEADRLSRERIANDRVEAQLLAASMRAGGRGVSSAQVNTMRRMLDDITTARGLSVEALLDYVRDSAAHLARSPLRGRELDAYAARLNALRPFAEQYIAMEQAFIEGGGGDPASGDATEFGFSPDGP